MVTPLQKQDVKVHLSNKEIGSWLTVQLTQHVKPVCGCQVKNLQNELNLPVNGFYFWSIWANNLSDKITVDQISSKLMVHNENRVFLAHLHATYASGCLASSSTLNSCKTQGCSYSGCTSYNHLCMPYCWSTVCTWTVRTKWPCSCVVIFCLGTACVHFHTLSA